MGQMVPESGDVSDAVKGNVWTDPEKLREIQQKGRDSYRAKRREEQIKRKAQAQLVLGPASGNATEAMQSRQLEDKSNEELADMIIRRQAKVLLLGGEPFAPISAKEATEIAHAWSAIAKNETVRKGKAKDDQVEDDSPAAEAAKAMAKLARKLKAVQDGQAV